MSVLIGHASISEKGTIRGTTGDQTGREVCTRSWYSKPWNVMLICTDKKIAEKAAQEMRFACANNAIGYDQGERKTAYNSGKANGGTFKNAKGETDCSQLVAACYIFAGLNISPDCYTGNLKRALLATGKFKAYTDAAHLQSDAYAEIGAIYLNEGKHVVMALENGSKAGGTANESGGGSTAAGTKVKVESARSRDKSLAGTYKVTASALNLRAGAGTGKKIITAMPRGAKVQCYGYYTDVSGTKWLYVVHKGQTGFASSKYLKK